MAKLCQHHVDATFIYRFTWNLFESVTNLPSIFHSWFPFHWEKKSTLPKFSRFDSIRFDIDRICMCVCVWIDSRTIHKTLWNFRNWRSTKFELKNWYSVVGHWTLCIRADKLATQRQHELIHKGNYIVYRFVCVFVVSYLLCFLRPFPSQPCANICWILFNATFMCQICIPKMHKPKCNLHTVHSTAWWS